MNKRMVRIYKDPNQQGSYINKTKAFLEKAQAGAQVDQKKMINAYMQSIYQKLKNEEEIDDIFSELVASGMSEAIAEKLLATVVDQMVAAGEMNSDNSVSDKEAEEEAAQMEKEKAEKEAAEQQQQEPQGLEEQEEEEPDQATDYFNSYGSEDDSYQADEYKDGGEQSCPKGYVKDENGDCVKAQAHKEIVVKAKRIDPAIKKLNRLREKLEYYDSQNDGLGPTSISDMYKRANIFKDIAELETKHKKKLRNTPRLNQANAVGNIMLTAGKYFMPKQAKTGVNYLLNVTDAYDYLQDPDNQDNQSSVASNMLSPFKSKRSKLAPFSTASDVINLKQQFDKFQNAKNQKYQDGGSIEDSQEESPYAYLLGQDPIAPGLNNYYESSAPLNFYEEPEYKRGGSKKSFVKNVLKKLKEGGEEQNQEIGQGNKFDTMTDEVSKRKSNFMNLIKEQANKAKIEDLYDKMMKSNKPELMKIAQTFSDDNPVPEDDTMNQGFQSGGYVGEEQPDMFMYGGTELPFYEADFLPEARYGYSVGNLRKAQKGDNGKLTEEELRQAKELGINDPGFSPDGTRQRINDARRNKWIDEQMQSKNNAVEKDNKSSKEKSTYIGVPYNAKTREAYTDSFEGLNPYAKTVYKRGLFGRPKQWTEYYTKGKGPAKALTPGQEIQAAYEKQLAENPTKLKHGVEKELWDDLSGKAKREIRRGERQLGREARRGAKSLAEDAAFNKGVHAQYKYNSEEDLARDQKRSDDAWNSKEKEFVSDIDNSVKSPYKDLVYNQDGDVVALPELLPTGYTDVKFEMPERPLEEDAASDKDMIDVTTARDEALEEKTLYEQMMKEEAAAKEEMDLDAERELMAPSAKIEADAQTRLNDFYKKDKKEESPIMSDKIRKNMQFENLSRFIPDNSKNMDLIRETYDKAHPEELQSRMKVQDRMESGFGLRYGGLPKAQTGPPVKRPSDPSTNTGDLSGMLKPAQNPNTLLGASQSFPGMPSNTPVNPDAGKVKTVTMDPNQTKGQTITSEDFGDPSNDDIIAIDKQRAPRNFDGEKAVNMFNVGATAVTGFLNNLDAAKQEKEMYENNFTSDNMYAASNSKDRGDYVDYGQQLGQFRYDQMGSDTSGRFAYGQTGGYMQEGGFAEDEVVYMTKEELEDFLANGGEVEYL